MVIRDVAGEGFAWANQSFLELSGWSASALRERPLLAFVEPADRAAFSEALEQGRGRVCARHVGSDAPSTPMDWEVRTEDGRLVVLGTLAGTCDTAVDAPAPPPQTERTGAPDTSALAQTLRAMAGIVEAHHPGLRCSILLLDESGRHVTVGAGPSLPDAYNAAVEGLKIGPFVGSCGTAAYWNRSVVVADIQREALWRDLRVEAAAAGVAACWSRPIRSETGQVHGALALYSPVPAAPNLDQLNGLEMAAKMVALAIDRGRASQSLRESEAALRQSQDRYRSLYEDNPSMYFTVDPHGTVLSVNKHGASCLGYAADDLVGKPVAQLFHPDDQASLQTQLQATLDKDGSVVRWELRKIHRSGRVMWVEESARVIRRADGERVMLVVSEDTTARKHANSLVQLQSSVLASIASGAALPRSLDLLCEGIEALVPGTACLVLLMDPSGTKLRTAAGPSFPPALLATLDGMNAEQSLGTCGAAVFLDQQMIIEDVDEAPAWHNTRHMARAHGVCASWSTPMHARSGDVLGAISLCHASPSSPTELDHQLMQTAAHLAGIAAERQMRDEGLRRRQKLESLGLMAGGVAHDFNNLLVPMMGQSTVALAKLSADDPARPHVKKAHEASERAADLTSQLLAYTGRGHFEVQPLDLNESIHATLHLFEVAVPKTVRLCQVIGTRTALIEADPGQVQQILMNLVLNAAESMGEQGGTVTIRTGVLKLAAGDPRFRQYTHEPLPAGEHVFLEVEDDGPGMEAATLSRMFDPFFTTKSSGRGLGLAAVAGIVRGHKGGLAVQSELGVGTTFSLVFPSCTAALAEEAPPSTEATLPKTATLVLIIDDEEPVLDAAADFLDLAGMQVLKANSGAAGIQLYEEHGREIELVLLDLSMPDMSGEETLQHLREIDPRARVLLTSGYNESEVASRFVGKPFAGFIKKPYGPDQLAQTVRALLSDDGSPDHASTKDG